MCIRDRYTTLSVNMYNEILALILIPKCSLYVWTLWRLSWGIECVTPLVQQLDWCDRRYDNRHTGFLVRVFPHKWQHASITRWNKGREIVRTTLDGNVRTDASNFHGIPPTSHGIPRYPIDLWYLSHCAGTGIYYRWPEGGRGTPGCFPKSIRFCSFTPNRLVSDTYMALMEG